MPPRTLDRPETGEAEKPRTHTLDAVVGTLRAAGVDFLPPNGGDPGFRLTRNAWRAQMAEPLGQTDAF